jgi:hypothetical protein
LVNWGRNLVASSQKGTLQWVGKKAPPSLSPLPLDDQPIGKDTEIVINQPESIGSIHTAALHSVSDV